MAGKKLFSNKKSETERVYGLQSFGTWADSLDSTRFMRSGTGKPEIVLVIPLTDAQEFHVYTSLTQEKEVKPISPTDCRVNLFDIVSNCSIEAHFPNPSGDNAWRWLNDCLQTANLVVEGLRQCSKCGAHSIIREVRATRKQFYGCSAFPACGRGGMLKHAYPLFDLDGGTKNVPEQNFMSAQQIVSTVYKKPTYTPLTPKSELIETSSYHNLDYTQKFPTFNKLQSTVLKGKYHKRDVNLVLGTQTSTGKTIAAELIAAPLLKKGDKVIYVSPLRSLSQERFDDWTENVLSEYNTVMLTGDTLSNKKERDLQMELASDADIIIMTSELLDSITRKAKASRNHWLKQVRLIVLDETHIISMEGRGAAVEVGAMRFCKYFPNAKILALSATLPNVEDFTQWLTNLNKKETEVINSKWRPTKLDWHLMPTNELRLTGEVYHNDADVNTLLTCMNEPDKKGEKWLVFVHTKAIGRKLVPILEDKGFGAQFHNADLDRESRLSIESEFAKRKGGLQVLVSTSTLAWGRTLPARNVAIFGTTRGPTEVDILDIIQMGGRAGRLGLDPKGDVYLILKGGYKESEYWKSKLEYPRPVLSMLLQLNVLTFHFLAEIANKVIYDLDSARKWSKRTLASIQMPIADGIIKNTFEQLASWGMVFKKEDGTYKITAFGKISSDYYVEPRDLLHWSRTGKLMTESNLWNSSPAIGWLLGGTPSLNPPWPIRTDEVMQYATQCAAVLGGDYNQYLSQTAYHFSEYINEEKPHFMIRQALQDVERTEQVCRRIGKVRFWDKDASIANTFVRARYGIPSKPN